MALFERILGTFSATRALRQAVRLSERGDAKGAFALLSRAARKRIPEAEYRVGRAYLEGAGVPPSRPQGVRWLERAATLIDA